MEFTGLDYYLLTINVIGFVLYIVNSWLYTHTEERQIDWVLTIASFLGGSLGIVIAILVFDRKAVKDNMMSRVFVFCVLIIQIIIVLVVKGYIKSDLTFDFWDFFSTHMILVIYLVIINVVTLIAFAKDKIAAIEHKSRSRIITLLGMAFIGGSLGALVAMYAFKHKTKKDYFSVGIPLIILMQIVVVFFLMNGEF